MVAQSRVDARSVANKPVAEGRKEAQQAAAVDARELLDDQAAAAAVVDAEQAEAVAAQVAADGGIMPTAAPAQSIGEVAQAPAPTTTDTTTATTPPPVGEEAAGLSPWAIGGIAALGVGAIALIANNDDDDDSPPPPPPPPPPPNGDPPPPVNVAPTSSDPAPVVAEADGTTALSADNFPFVDTAGDVLTTVKIGTITATAIDHTPLNDALAVRDDGHGYELVQGVSTWAEASAAATARGGYLAVLDTVEEMAFVQANFDGFGAPEGLDGAWIGLSQAATATAVDGDWTWVDGTPLAADSPLWSTAFDGLPGDFRDAPFEADLENHEADFGAIYDGASPTDTALIYDRGAGGNHANAGEDTLPQYLIEYNTTAPLTLNGAAVADGQVIAAADLGALTWNSVFNTGGTVTFSVGDPAGAYSTPENTLTVNAPAPITMDAGASQSIATLIEDQHLSQLA